MNAKYTSLMSNFAMDVKISDGEIHVNVKMLSLLGGPEEMTQRLISLWLAIPEAYRHMGWTWYAEANSFAEFLAETYGYTIWQTSQVIAVLSPQNPWDGKYAKNGARMSDGNRLCAVKVIDTFYRFGPEAVMALKGWGYAGEFLRKAIKVLQGIELDWSGAPKTYRFAMLIADPTRLDIAVIDSHASRIATGNLGGRYHVVQKSAYPVIESAYMNASAILGIPAYVLQAGLWTVAIEGEFYQ